MKNRLPLLFLAACAASLSLSLSYTPLVRADDDAEVGGGDAPTGEVGTDEGNTPTEEEWILMTSTTGSAATNTYTGTIAISSGGSPGVLTLAGTEAAGTLPALDKTFRLVAPHLYASTAVFPVSSSLTLTSVTWSNTTITASNVPPIIGPPVIIPEEGTPAFSGTVSKVEISTGDNKKVLKVKAKVRLTNVAGKTLRGITATVYLSGDDVLDAGDTRVVTLDFGDFFAKNKLGKGQTRKLRLDREVPAALASLLEGKYLIVDLKAKNASDTGEDYPIVVGPIDLP